MQLAGVDGCKAGWVAVTCAPGQPAAASAEVVSTLDALLGRPEIGFALVDMPIGLGSGAQSRNVEPAMRALLPGKGSSVFNAPAREALAAESHAEASAINRARLGKGLSRQSFALFPKIREADRAARRHGNARIREGHPELSLAIVTGQPVLSKKRSAEGQAERRRIVSGWGFPVEALIAQARGPRCQPDDIVDATILLNSALRRHRNQHVTIPPQPDSVAAGLEMSVIA